VVIDISPFFRSILFRTILVVLCFPVFLCVSAAVCPAENALSVGYGLGLFNEGASAGHLGDDGRSYDYALVSFLHERPLTEHVAWVVEPFVKVVNRPENGIDVGFSVSLRGYLPELAPGHRLYLAAGAGAVYTSINFEEQGTHGLFVLVGGIGYRTGRVFVEAQFQHYSNGGLANPNHSVNSGLLRAGWYF